MERAKERAGKNEECELAQSMGREPHWRLQDFLKQPCIVYSGLLLFVLAGIGIWMLPVMYGIIFPPDEYGYWANAAAMLGLDWTEVNGLNPYYSYGYSMALMVVWKAAELAYGLWGSAGMPSHVGMTEGTMPLAYCMAIVVNLAFAWLHGILLWKLLRKLFQHMDEKKCAAICLCGAFYPSVLVYMQYTLSEILLNLVFLWLVWRVIRYAEAVNNTGKQRAKALYADSAILAAASAIMYIVHMRTIGIWMAFAIAAAADVLLSEFEEKENLISRDEKAAKKKRRQFSKRQMAAFVFLGVSIVLFLGAELAKDILQEMLYGDTGLAIIQGNDYGGRLEALGKLFTISGLIDCIVSCAGKLFYLGNTTFGLYYFALALLYRKGREKAGRWRVVWWFLAGAVVMNFGVSALGMSGVDRVDGLLYGRYNETVMPFMVCLGLVELFRHADLWKKAAHIAVLHGFLLGMVSIYASIKEVTTWLPDFAIGIAYAAGQKPDTVQQIFVRPYLCGLVGMGILFLIVRLIQRRKIKFVCIGVLAAAYLGIAVMISMQNIRPHQRDNLGDMQIARTIQKLQQEEVGREVWLLHSEWNEYADTLQFYLPKQQIHVIAKEKADLFLLDERGLIVTYKNDTRDEAMGLFYKMAERSWHLNLYYNP